MITEVTFRFDVNESREPEKFELKFERYSLDEDWVLIENNMDNFYVDKNCARRAFIKAFELLELLNERDR